MFFACSFVFLLVKKKKQNEELRIKNREQVEVVHKLFSTLAFKKFNPDVENFLLLHNFCFEI